jgi:hypothetical protein
MKNIQNAAFVVSIQYGNTNEVARINVKWKGNHEISDFNFDRFGESSELRERDREYRMGGR